MNRIPHNKSCDSSCCLRLQNVSVKAGTNPILENVSSYPYNDFLFQQYE